MQAAAVGGEQQRERHQEHVQTGFPAGGVGGWGWGLRGLFLLEPTSPRVRGKRLLLVWDSLGF